MRTIKKGATSQTVYVEILDSTSTTGGRKTGLAYNTSSLTAYYVRNGGSATAITLATLAAANSAWSSGGFKEVDATNMPGIYRLDVPDAAFATGVDSVAICLKGATGMVQVSLVVQLVAYDPQDAVRAGLTALPNAAAEAAGGLYTRGTGSGQINQPANGMADVNVVRNAGTAITSSAGRQEVNVSHYGGTAGTFASGRPEVNTTHAAGTAWGSGGITAGSIAASALNGKGDWNVGKTGYTVSTVSDKTGYSLSSAGIQAIWDALTSALTTVGSIGKLLVDNINATISSRSTYAGGDTSGVTTLLSRIVGTLASGTHNPQSGDNYARLGAPAGASVSADIAAVKSDTGALRSAFILGSGTATAGSGSTITLQTALGANHLGKGCVIAIIGGTGVGQARIIYEYTNSSKVAQVTATWDVTPDNTSIYVILNTYLYDLSNLASLVGNVVDGVWSADIGSYADPTTFGGLLNDIPPDVADAVWDELIAGHAVSGSTGEALSNAGAAGTPPTAAAIADAVWEETLGDHSGTSGSTAEALAAAGGSGDPWITPLPGSYSAGQAGKIVGDALDAAISSRLATGGYTAPDNSSITAIKAKTDNLPASPAATGDAMTLTTGERSSIGTAVWATTTRTLSSFGTLVSDIAAAVWAAATRTLSAFGFTVDTNANSTETAIKAKTDNLPVDPADASDIAGAFGTVNSTLSTIAGYIDTEVAAIKAKTDNLPASPAAVSDIPTATENADELLKRDWTSVTGEASRSVLNALRFIRNKFSTSASPGYVTIYKEDDATAAYTKAITTDAAADPITEG